MSANSSNMSRLVDYSRFDALEVSDDEDAAKPTNAAVFEASGTIREWRRTQEKMYDAARRDVADEDLDEIWDDIPPHMRPPGLEPPPRAPAATETASSGAPSPPSDLPAAAPPPSDAPVAAAVVKATRGLRRCLDAQRQLRGDAGGTDAAAAALEPDLFALWDPARTGSCDAQELRGTLEGCGLTPDECELLVDALAPPVPPAAGRPDAPRRITCEEFVRVFSSAHEPARA